MSVKDRILGVAKKLFATNGYENTSTMSVARSAQTSESQILKYFGSKEGLLEAIFEDGWHHASEGFGAIEYLPSPGAKLQALFGIVLSRLDEDSELKQLVLLEGRKIRKEGHMVMMTNGFLEVVKLVDGLLEQMRESGQLRADLHPHAVRSVLIGMMEGLLRDQMLAGQLTYPADFTSDDIRELFLHVLQSFTAGSARVLSATRAQH